MHPLLRLLGFFVLITILMRVLQNVPVIGGLFHGFIGFWATAIGLVLLMNHYSRVALERRRTNVQIHDLGNVDRPHNQGKLGSLLLAGGRPGKAVPHLEQAVEGEPDVTEWHFRLGTALLALGRNEEAVASLGRAAEMNEEYGYGGVQLRLSEANLAAGDSDAALAQLDVFDRNHGPNPESAYRRGLALKKAGRRQEAGESFARVGELARGAARFQRREAQKWVFRAMLARLV